MRSHIYLGAEVWNVVLGLNSLTARLWYGSSSAYSSKSEKVRVWTWYLISEHAYRMQPPRRAWDSYWGRHLGQFSDSVIEVFVHWVLYSRHLTISWTSKFWIRSPETSVTSPRCICKRNILSCLSSVWESPRQTCAFWHFRPLKPLWCATLLYCSRLPATQLCMLKLPVEWSKNCFSFLQSDFIKTLEQVWLIKKCWHQLVQLSSLSETS